MKKFEVLCFLILFSITMDGQQGPVYNLYFQDAYYLNPAAAGARGLTTFTINAKEFWLGFPENTPGTQSLMFHARLNKIRLSNKGRSRGRYGYSKQEGRVGFGAMLYNDYNGPIRKTGITTSYSYTVRLQNSMLSFGLSSNSYQVFTSIEKFNLKSPDPTLSLLESFYVTDANVGIYLNSRDYFISFSTNNLFSSGIKFNETKYITYVESRNYNVLLGYDYKLNNRLNFEPSVYYQMMEIDNSLYNRSDLNFKFIYNKKLFFGGCLSRLPKNDDNGFKPNVKLFFGVLSENMDFGYSYQIPRYDIIEYNKGSHEILFTMKFGQNRFNRYQRFYR